MDAIIFRINIVTALIFAERKCRLVWHATVYLTRNCYQFRIAGFNRGILWNMNILDGWTDEWTDIFCKQSAWYYTKMWESTAKRKKQGREEYGRDSKSKKVFLDHLKKISLTTFHMHRRSRCCCWFCLTAFKYQRIKSVIFVVVCKFISSNGHKKNFIYDIIPYFGNLFLGAAEFFRVSWVPDIFFRTFRCRYLVSGV